MSEAGHGMVACDMILHSKAGLRCHLGDDNEWMDMNAAHNQRRILIGNINRSTFPLSYTYIFLPNRPIE